MYLLTLSIPRTSKYVWLLTQEDYSESYEFKSEQSKSMTAEC